MKFEESMLSGYIDGELNDEERAVVERRLAESSKDRELLRVLTDLHHKLSSMPNEIFRSDPVEGVRQRIAAERLTSSASGDISSGLGKAVASDNDQVEHRGKFDGSESVDSATRSKNNFDASPGRGLWLSLLALAATLLLVVGSWQWQRNLPLATNNPAVKNDAAAPKIAESQIAESQIAESQIAESRASDGLERSPAAQAIGSQADSAAADAGDMETDDLPQDPAPKMLGGGRMLGRSQAMLKQEQNGLEGGLASDSAMAPQRANELSASEQSAIADSAIADSALALSVPQEQSGGEVDSDGELKLLTLGKQSDTPTYFEPASVPFDRARSIGVKVPVGWTDDTLRLIRDFVHPLSSEDADSRLLTETEAVDDVRPVAVLVDASPQQLAGLVQAIRQWAEQADRQESPRRAMMFAGPGGDPSSDATVSSARQSDPPPADSAPADSAPANLDPKEAGSELGGPLQLGAEAGAGVRDGRVWIIIRPAVIRD